MLALVSHAAFASSRRSFVLSIAATLALVLVVDSIVVTRANYTEVDWVAYMMEVETFLKGEVGLHLPHVCLKEKTSVGALTTCPHSSHIACRYASATTRP